MCAHGDAAEAESVMARHRLLGWLDRGKVAIAQR
jgi:hypothetical protein